MDAPPVPQNLELSVSDFGPIAQGRIELRPMTVFVGPSNTGKSYLAVLTYALHRAFRAYSDSIAYGRGRFSRLALSYSPATELSYGDVSEILDWADEARGELGYGGYGGRFERELPEPIEIPDAVAALLRAEISGAAILGELLDSEVTRCFGVEQAGNLSSYPSGGLTWFAIKGKVAENGGHRSVWGYECTVSDEMVVAKASIPHDMPLRITRPIRLPRSAIFRRWSDGGSERREHNAAELLEILSRAVTAGIIGPLNRPAYYLPADRSGVMHAHQVVVRALIANATRGGISYQAPLPVLSGVLGDFLGGLLDMANERRIGRGPGRGLARSLEKDLLKGGINIDNDDIDYPSFVYRPDGWDRNLPLMNASSMVSELAPVALYLRYVAQPGDTLIIEEPESHLHPEMQVEFVRQLAAAVKSGIRIIITTHSEWILEELANLIRLSDLPAERRHGIAGSDVALGWDEVGAWFFEPGPAGQGSTVREMPLDIEEGMFPSGFGLVTANLYNRWAEISNRIEQEA